MRANPRNPRKLFSDAELDRARRLRSASAASSSRSSCGRRAARDNFEIIAGERRWRAAQRAGLHEVPVVVLDVTDGEALELAIIENVQRADLNPLEEANGYQSLDRRIQSFSQDDIAKIVGKSRSHIANTMRLLKLPERVKAYINSGKLTAGHARMLVGQPNAEELARRDRQPGSERAPGRSDGARERQAARRARRKRTGRLGKDADTLALEKRLTDALGLLVSIDHRANGGGMLQVRYRTLEQLDDVVRRLEAGPTIEDDADGSGGPRIRRT